MGLKIALAVGVAVLMILPGAAAVGLAVGVGVANVIPHSPRSSAPLVVPGPGSFAFVSNFEDMTTDGWAATSGSAQIVASPNYNGEPSLQSTARHGSPQVDVATHGIVAGDSFLSFQANLRYSSDGTGFVGLLGPSGPVAVVGVGGSNVWAGPTPAQAVVVAPVPTGTAQPSGWAYLSANVYETAASGQKVGAWVMDVYVDRSDVAAAAQVGVPDAGSYSEAILETTQGTMDYTNIVVTNFEIPSLIPGYNNMDGYGQGSGLLIQLLPQFTTLRASMTLSSWNIPQTGILSFQINAMNYYGTTRSTCKGFFQLGIDLDPNGNIAPWYVEGTNCVAHYFSTSNSPAISSGFSTPPGTHLSLTIQDVQAEKAIFFQIVDHSVASPDRFWNATIPYNGTEFFGTYTQIEWQPCCSNFPIGAYFFNGTLDHMQIGGGSLSTPQAMGAEYMLPFALDMPPSWNLGYYNAAVAGYDQVG